jgi:hypothetical protein
MTLIVEDGTGVVNANTYASDAALTTYAAARGITTLPALAADREVLLIKAMDYLESQRFWFVGTKNLQANALQWPRANAFVDGFALLVTAIPKELIAAQCVLAIAAITYDLSPVLPSGLKGAVKRETVGPITMEYTTPKDTLPRVIVQQADDLLRAITKPRILSVARY